ncbi:MAG: flavodoxin-dependent (E)-4-hydroxy-3-methylbut-2-enyl-diphosphate synthase [SAR202 cluster bacterium]|nr:flavodoxin-dependent (E)-4-hydroxy-3-methylbut-2-enyl-diphosphate synthase [SAR202 cluster bacterium]
MAARRATRQISVGGVKIGGRNNPVVVQSMTKSDTRDVARTVAEIKGAEAEGCEIIRSAVPDMAAADALVEIKRQISIPLIADIHFHHELALASIKNGVDGLRLNPGNIRDADKVREVVRAAQRARISIRIGVNFGSLPPVGKIGASGGRRVVDGVNELPTIAEAMLSGRPDAYTVVDHMVATALWEISILEALDFDDIKISLKAFDVPTTVESYRRLATLVPYPFHLGITESGTVRTGSIRSAVGLGVLLYEGIGDTIRVSLAGDCREEVKTGFEILKSLNLRNKGTTLVACPSCGRADIDVLRLTAKVDELLKGRATPIKVAVMGCEVNGPGEAKDADVGIAGGNGRAVIFRKGAKARVVPEAEMLEALMSEVEKAEEALKARA